ncbi:FadR/GntR family transcriptional regulator [Rhizohabitans arisaemae]|uniref:FadR/GntR family transcriptional regulator n=1 Tax=Rhizohabitans arisaemae TaxID=2720610 RepID=UPI0024B1E4D3|nr:GntR family transcriptional regulator [Rhizohabitans arisaemae]
MPRAERSRTPDGGERRAASGTPPVFRPARHTRLYEEVASQLREAILSGVYRPGERLPTERELMGMFDVSRAVARQATMNLEHEGLVEVQVGSGGGAFVAAPTVNAVHRALENHMRHSQVSVLDYLAAKRILEPVLATAVLAGASTDDLRRLQENVDLSRSALARGRGAAELLRLSLDFHEILVAATGNPVLEALFIALVRMGNRVPAFTSATAHHDWEHLFEEHAQVLTALRAGDAGRFTALMLRHLDSVDEIYTEQPTD